MQKKTNETLRVIAEFNLDSKISERAKLISAQQERYRLHVKHNQLCRVINKPDMVWVGEKQPELPWTEKQIKTYYYADAFIELKQIAKDALNHAN